MTWQPPARSAVAEQIYAAAEQDRTQRPDRYSLDVDSVVERAEKRFSAELFADGWRAGLAEFLDSAAQEARLNAVERGWRRSPRSAG